MTTKQIGKIFDKVNEELCREMWGYLGIYLGISVEYVEDYFDEDDFRYSNFIGMFCPSCQSDVNVFPIAINLKVVNEIPVDEREREVYLTIYHELGHALIAYLDDNDFEFDDKGIDEEELAEDFAKAFLNGGVMKTVIWENVELYINGLEESVS